MTTVIPFQPTQDGPFSFQASFDGQVYTCLVTWSLGGQRWYLNVYTLTGTLILTLAMGGSTTSNNLNLLKGYFSSQLYYVPSLNIIVIEP